jgi:uncharacterized delta-60 repeat protein
LPFPPLRLRPGHSAGLEQPGRDDEHGGKPDSSFGHHGKTAIPVAEGENRDGPWGGVAVQETGRIVTGGVVLQGADNANRDFALVGLKPNGKLDTAFGVGGFVKLAIAPGNEDDVVWTMILDRKDRIVVAGEYGGFDNATGDFAVARFKEDGELDKSFGSGGTVITPIGVPDSYNQPYGVAIQTDGAIVASGECDDGDPTGIDVCVARYKAK